MATTKYQALFLLTWFCRSIAPAQTDPLADPAALDREIVAEVRQVLDGACQSKTQPNLEAWWAALKGENDEARARVGARLHTLLVLAEQDRKEGRGPGNSGFKLYAGPQDFIGEMRWHLAKRLGRTTWSGNGEAAQAAALWLFRNSTRIDECTSAVEAIVRIRTLAADDVVREIVHKSHSTFRVLAMALKAAGQRELRDLAADVSALRDHYHSDVREAAIAAARALGRTDEPATADPNRMTPMFARWLDLAAELAAEQVPLDAPWGKVTFATEPFALGSQPKTVEGFVLSGPGGVGKRILTAWGSLRAIDVARDVIAPASLADYGKGLLALRARYNEADMEEQERIEAQSGIARFIRSSGERWEGSAAEILTAAWLHRRGDDELACQLVLPMLRIADDESQFFTDLLANIAVASDEVMLEAFVYQRDYARASEIAKKLARPEYSFWYHQDRAQALAEQLPRRLEDFRELKLPDAASWRELKTTMSRRAQIEFLAARLRLLNCMQMSTPGGIHYGDDQYAKPFAAHEWQHGLEPEKVINPYVELLRLNLLAEELELLLPLIESSDYILAYDLHRFLPMKPQTLHRVRWVVADLIDAIACEDLVDSKRLEGGKAARDGLLADLRGWCKRNAGVSLGLRLAERLDGEKDFTKWRSQFWKLNAVDEAIAADAAIRLARSHPEHRAAVSKLFVLLGREEQLKDASDWYFDADADPELRFWSALLLIASGSDKEGKCLDYALKRLADEETTIVNAALPALLAGGGDGGRAFLINCLQGKGPSRFQPRFAFAGELMRQGIPEAFDMIDAALAKPDECKLYDWSNDRPLTEPGRAASLVLEWFPNQDGNSPGDADVSGSVQAARERLRKEWESVRAGKSSTLPRLQAHLELPWGEWTPVQSSGWIRRL